MSEEPKNPFQFWEELKRRKVPKVLAMYAASAFILLEVVDIVSPALSLPSWTVTLVVVLLAIGFPITAILSWIFDITPDGIQKTASIESAPEDLTPPNRRKLRIGDVIIVVLIVVVGILVYPKLFKKDKFKGIRDADGRISVAVMPFQNITNDSLYSGMGLGIQNLLITSLSNSEELTVRQSQTMHDVLESTKQLNYASITPTIASEIALKLEANTVILGSIHKSGNSLRITANLLDSGTEEIYKSFEIDGDSEDDFFSLTDSLTGLIKNHLEIKVLELDVGQETRLHAITASAEAFSYFSKGMNKFYSQDYQTASFFFNRALELDPDFFGAAFFQVSTLEIMGMISEARQLTNKYYNNINQYTYGQQIVINYWQNYLDKNQQETIKYAKLRLEEDPMDRIMWYALGINYYRGQQYQEAIQAFEKALEIDKSWGGGWDWVWIYAHAGAAYHETGQHTMEENMYELGLSILPDNPEIIAQQAICSLSLDDTVAANKYLAKYRSIRESEGMEEYWINFFTGLLYVGAKKFIKAIDFYEDIIAQNSQGNQDPWCKWQLGYLLINHEIDVEGGLQLINESFEKNSGYAYLLANLHHAKGWGLHKQDKDEEALVHLSKGWKLRPYYDHDHFLHIKEVEKALTEQNNSI
ncbi:MAG: tetratricopeptide repeat protein [Bacteroidales bacterium]|nr:tetratricopeptide repeat protein [Bacteroidales bacterium]